MQSPQLCFCNTPFGGQLFHFQGGMGDFRKRIRQTDFKGEKINSYNEKKSFVAYNPGKNICTVVC